MLEMLNLTFILLPATLSLLDKKKINLWLSAPKGVTPVKQTSATDGQMNLLDMSSIMIYSRNL